MKKLVCFLVILLILSFCVIYVSAEERSNEYTVNCIDGEYRLLVEEEEVMRDSSILPIISEIGEGYVHFNNVRIYETLDLTDTQMTISGSIFLDSDADIIIRDGAEFVFLSLDLKMLSAGSEIIVCGGNLLLDSAVISTLGECAMRLESGKLTILNESIVSGSLYDIKSNSVISFVDEFGQSYTGKYKFRIKKSDDVKCISEVAVLSKGAIPPFALYSSSGDEIIICRVTYINEFGDNFSEYRLKDEEIILPSVDVPSGYGFCGWCMDGVVLNSTTSVSSSATFYAEYKLDTPSFSVNGANFEYDGKTRSLIPEDIYHPLLSEGEIKFKWYYNGRVVSERETLLIRDVRDSGAYKLEAEFVLGEDRSYAFAEDIDVKIEPKHLKLEYRDGAFEIASGEILSGDTVNIKSVEKDGKIYAETDNYNYCLDFYPVNVKNHKTEITILAWTLVVIAIIVAVAYFVFWTAERDMDIASSRRTCTLYSEDPFVLSREDDGDLREAFFSIDAVKANELISDKMAKSMITKGGIVITGGEGITEIGIGEINSSFHSGELVDINELKNKKMIYSNAGRVRITSDGTIDKPLKIVADEFDLAAVKMISLSGGEAIKIKSRKKI